MMTQIKYYLGEDQPIKSLVFLDLHPNAVNNNLATWDEKLLRQISKKITDRATCLDLCLELGIPSETHDQASLSAHNLLSNP